MKLEEPHPIMACNIMAQVWLSILLELWLQTYKTSLRHIWMYRQTGRGQNIILLPLAGNNKYYIHEICNNVKDYCNC